MNLEVLTNEGFRERCESRIGCSAPFVENAPLSASVTFGAIWRRFVIAKWRAEPRSEGLA